MHLIDFTKKLIHSFWMYKWENWTRLCFI